LEPNVLVWLRFDNLMGFTQHNNYFIGVSEQEKKPAVASRSKNYQFGNRAGQAGAKLTYKSKVAELKKTRLMWGP
jgi:hypothetical protein